MAILVESGLASNYVTAQLYESGVGNIYGWGSGPAEAVLGTSAGTASSLTLKINAWGTTQNVKACIYEDDALVEEVIINKSVATGDITVALAGTLAISAAKDYVVLIYTDTNSADFGMLTWNSGSATGGARRRRTGGSYASPIATNVAGTWFGWNGFYWGISDAPSGLTLDSAPSTMAKGETGVQFVVSTPATAPTTGNTTVISSGDALTVTSVTGSGPYTINCTVPVDISKQVGSYAWTVTVDLENVVSASIPLTSQSGWSSVALVSPVTTVGSILNGYTGDVPVTGDSLEYVTTADLTIGDDGEWIWDAMPTVTQVVARRVIQADGTVGATEDATFTVSSSDGYSIILRNVLRSVTRNITKTIFEG